MKALIIFYDGYCVLCNFWVRQICRWDYKDQFRFASLDSKHAEKMFKETGFDSSSYDSVLVWDQKSVPLTESAAVFSVLRTLGGVWHLFFIFKLLPNVFLNWTYKCIAKRRYRWFGKKETCPVPKDSIRHKFL